MNWNIFVYSKCDFYMEFTSKYAAVSHMTNILMEHYLLTSSFRIQNLIHIHIKVPIM